MLLYKSSDEVYEAQKCVFSTLCVFTSALTFSTPLLKTYSFTLNHWHWHERKSHISKNTHKNRLGSDVYISKPLVYSAVYVFI